jgi:hypothetical protein
MRPKLGNARNRAFSTALALMRSMAGPHKAGFLNSLLKLADEMFIYMAQPEPSMPVEE